jgi:dihydroxyacetone kinase-like predicted kinase
VSAALAAALDVGRGALDRVSAAHPVLREAHVVDSGACALLVVLDALAAALAPGAAEVDLGWLPAAGSGEPAPGVPGVPGCGVPVAPGTVEVMAVLPGSAVPDLAARLHALGDAVAVVEGSAADGGPVRHAHVHTTDPAPVLALLREAGAREARVEALDAGSGDGAVVPLDAPAMREDA